MFYQYVPFVCLPFENPVLGLLQHCNPTSEFASDLQGRRGTSKQILENRGLVRHRLLVYLTRAAFTYCSH